MVHHYRQGSRSLYANSQKEQEVVLELEIRYRQNVEIESVT